ncbi:hypothetical protein CCP3SC15_390017 [Gammaproteobacteria bacterium]
MMHIDSGNYYGLDEVGSSIWNQLAQPTSIRAICDAIQGEFMVERERCEADALKFLEGMVKDGLVVQVNLPLFDSK